MMPPALPENPTGADLAAALRAEAHRRGQTLTAFAAPLSPKPAAWIHTMADKKRPRASTVARVRALLAGEPVPPQPSGRNRAIAASGSARKEFARATHALDADDSFARAAARRTIAKSTSTVAHPIPLDRPSPIAMPAIEDGDPRPPAWSREPCRRCQTRGDLGCAHQRPFVPEQAL